MENTMKKIRALLIIISTFALPYGLLSQTEHGTARNSFGLHAGYSFLAGDWNKARPAPEINLFKGYFTFGGDVDFRLSNLLSLAFEGGYEPLYGSDWESYARQQGDTVSVSASFGYFSIMLRPYINIGGLNVIRLEVGPALLLPGGSEVVNGRYYSYDFFNTVRIGGKGGIEYDRMLNNNIAASLGFSVIIFPKGVSYADGDSRSVIFLPLNLGIRFYY
jgi:hypothetical protein